MPDYYMVKGKIRASYRERKRILTRLNTRFKKGKTDRTDGLRVDYPEFWFHIRPSNTEPVIRIIVESRDKEKAQDIYKRIREEI